MSPWAGLQRRLSNNLLSLLCSWQTYLCRSKLTCNYINAFCLSRALCCISTFHRKLCSSSPNFPTQRDVGKVGFSPPSYTEPSLLRLYLKVSKSYQGPQFAFLCTLVKAPGHFLCTKTQQRVLGKTLKIRSPPLAGVNGSPPPLHTMTKHGCP